MNAEQRFDKLLLSQYARHPNWPRIRKSYLKNFDRCAVCGAKRRLVAHHIYPYHLYPEKELNMHNLITLCESHHLLFGHLNDYKSFNLNVFVDAMIWADRIRARPNKRRYLKVKGEK